MIAPHGVKFMLLAAGLLVAGSVWAQAPGERGPEGMGPMRGLERLHKELNLNSQQEELWKRAQAAQREAHRSMRAQGEETQKQVREAWFAVYDTLDAGQREKVRVAIRDGMDRMDRMGRHRGGPRSEMHG